MGLGHVRRNMLLAQSVLEAHPDADVLLLSGVRESGAFKLPQGADSVTLPTYVKTSEGKYIPRSLGNDITRLVKIRKEIISAALDAFEPDIVIIDNVPRGAMNELDNILPELASRGTHIILGVRDIIDEPEAVLILKSSVYISPKFGSMATLTYMISLKNTDYPKTSARSCAM